jgi:hypothetical protein
MIQILQRALDASVAPTRVLSRHPHDEAADLREHTRPPGTPFGVRPFSGDEVPMPSQNRVECDDRRDLRQHPTAQPLAKRGQPSPVIIRQPQTLMAQLGLQHAVFFAQVQDDLVLFVLEPAEEGRDEKLHRNHGAESTPTAGRGFRSDLRSFIPSYATGAIARENGSRYLAIRSRPAFRGSKPTSRIRLGPANPTP